MHSNEKEGYEKEKNFGHPGDGPGWQHGAGWMWRQWILTGEREILRKHKEEEAKQVMYAEWERLQKQANRREEILLQKIVELQDKRENEWKK